MTETLGGLDEGLNYLTGELYEQWPTEAETGKTAMQLWAPAGSWKCGCVSFGTCWHVFAAGHQVGLSKAMVIGAHPHAQTCYLLESWPI